MSIQMWLLFWILFQIFSVRFELLYTLLGGNGVSHIWLWSLRSQFEYSRKLGNSCYQFQSLHIFNSVRQWNVWVCSLAVLRLYWKFRLLIVIYISSIGLNSNSHCSVQVTHSDTTAGYWNCLFSKPIWLNKWYNNLVKDAGPSRSFKTILQDLSMNKLYFSAVSWIS